MSLSRYLRQVERLVRSLTGKPIPAWAWVVLLPVLAIGWVLREVWHWMFGG